MKVRKHHPALSLSCLSRPLESLGPEENRNCHSPVPKTVALFQTQDPPPHASIFLSSLIISCPTCTLHSSQKNPLAALGLCLVSWCCTCCSCLLKCPSPFLPVSSPRSLIPLLTVLSPVSNGHSLYWVPSSATCILDCVDRVALSSSYARLKAPEGKLSMVGWHPPCLIGFQHILPSHEKRGVMIKSPNSGTILPAPLLVTTGKLLTSGVSVSPLANRVVTSSEDYVRIKRKLQRQNGRRLRAQPLEAALLLLICAALSKLLDPLCLSFLIYKMGIAIVPISQGYINSEYL